MNLFKHRVISALIMIVTVIATVFYAPTIVLHALLAFIFFLAAWEWAKLSSITLNMAIFLLVINLALLFILHSFILTENYPDNALKLAKMCFFPATMIWIMVAFYLSIYPRFSEFLTCRFSYALQAIVLFIPPWLGISFLHKFYAPLWLMFILSCIWAVDIGGYCAGKLFGRYPLVPIISPKKTIEGVIGSILSATLVTLIFNKILSSSQLIWGLTACIVLGSIVGDLFESAIKRLHAVKDSGNIIPGHGGVLDRIDSLLCAIPLACSYMLYFRFDML